MYLILKSFRNLKENCGEFCDKYIEYDEVLILLDLILNKISVYRHLIVNVEQLKKMKEVCTTQIVNEGKKIIAIDSQIRFFDIFLFISSSR